MNEETKRVLEKMPVGNTPLPDILNKEIGINYYLGDNSSLYATNNVNVEVLLKSSGSYKKVNAILGFDNRSIYITLLDLNTAGNNFASYNTVTEIIVPPFTATFSSDLC